MGMLADCSACLVSIERSASGEEVLALAINISTGARLLLKIGCRSLAQHDLQCSARVHAASASTPSPLAP